MPPNSICAQLRTGMTLPTMPWANTFIGYGICLTILLLVGQYWLRRTGRSQEFFDSLIIAAYTVPDEGGAHDEMGQTLTEVIIATEAERGNAAE
jgi:hypothetical protein